LREDGHHPKEHAAHRRGVVEVFGHRGQRDIVAVQFAEVLQRGVDVAREPVKSVNQQDFDQPGLGVARHRLEAGPPVVLARLAGVFINLDHDPQPALGELATGAFLRAEREPVDLLIRRHALVDGNGRAGAEFLRGDPAIHQAWSIAAAQAAGAGTVLIVSGLRIAHTVPHG
jgi:hypothetical protein